MSKRLILFLALVFVAGIAFAAYAEVQNVKVSGDLTVTGIMRNSLTLRDNEGVADFGEKIDAMLSQVRVRIDADLTDNVSATVRLLNERVWGDEADNDNNTANNRNTSVNIDLAYVTMKEFLYSPLSLKIGRQNLRYGNGLVIGDPDTNGIADGHLTASRPLPNSLDDLSLRKSFDAVKAILNYDPLVIDLVASKIDENDVAETDDTNLIGVNAAYTVNENLMTEAYLWQRSRRSDTTAVRMGNTQTENLRTVGARGMYSGIENVVLGLESAFQFGDHISNAIYYPNENAANAAARLNRKVTAYAIQGVASLALPKMKYTPVLGGSYTYLSGDKYLSTSDNYRGWDPMYEDQAGGTLFNKIMGYSNAMLANLNATLIPMEDVKVRLDYYYLRLVNPFTTTTAVTLTQISDPTYVMQRDKKSLGSEIDLGVTYDYTEDVQFMLNTGAFIPGNAFDSRNKKTATQVIGSMKVTF